MLMSVCEKNTSTKIFKNQILLVILSIKILIKMSIIIGIDSEQITF